MTQPHLYIYLHFDLDDADAVKSARAALEREFGAPEKAEVTVLTLGSVATVRVSQPVDDANPDLAIERATSVSNDAWCAGALSACAVLVVPPGQDDAAGRQCCDEFYETPIADGYARICPPQETGGARLVVVTCQREPGESLLDTDLPRLDVALRRLELQADQCRNDAVRISRARREADDAIGRVLHESIVLRKGGPDRVEEMHKQTEELTSTYGILASDSVILQEGVDRILDFRRVAERAVGKLSIQVTSGLLMYTATVAADALRDIQVEQNYLHTSLDKAKTAIDVVRTHVELDRSDQNIKLQERALALQVAAGFVEFVIVFYYVLNSWEPLAGATAFEHIPAWVRFTLVGAVAGTVVAASHQVAEAIRERERRRWLIAGGLLVLLVLLVAKMFAASILFGGSL